MTSPSMPIKIATDIPGLYLRSPEPNQHDAEALSKIFSHEHNSRFEPPRPGRVPPSAAHYLTKIPAWRESAEKGRNCFCVITLSGTTDDQDKVVGFGGFNAFESRPSAEGGRTIKVVNVGVMLHEPFTGKGYGIAAMRATIENSFDLFGADLVEAETLQVNQPFRGLMKKLKLDQFSMLKSEDGLDEVNYSFTKAQWHSVR